MIYPVDRSWLTVIYPGTGSWPAMLQWDPNAGVPNASYIPTAGVGAHVGLVGIRVGLAGVRVGSTNPFGYKVVGIGNAK